VSIIHQANHLARRLEATTGDLESRVRAAFSLTLGRLPDEEEIRDWSNHARRHGLSSACQILFNCDEFLFIN
jgi:hypothetical protein